MAKLHELLAVDASLKGQAQKMRLELQNTLEKKRHLFAQKLITYTPLDANASPEIREQSDIQTTVKAEVKWLSDILVKAIDSSFAIDIANTEAYADIILESGHVIAKQVPATALLQIEKRLKEVSEFIHTIPTIDPAKGFTLAPEQGDGIYKAREVNKDSTKKIEEFIVVVQATKEHPAQASKVTKDVVVGKILEQEWSSLITPALKAELLSRSEELYRAVTKARSRANETAVDTDLEKIGEDLLGFIFQPLT